MRRLFFQSVTHTTCMSSLAKKRRALAMEFFDPFTIHRGHFDHWAIPRLFTSLSYCDTLVKNQIRKQTQYYII